MFSQQEQDSSAMDVADEESKWWVNRGTFFIIIIKSHSGVRNLQYLLYTSA